VAESIEAQETRLNVWAGKSTDEYTQDSDLDWAFCTPVRAEARPKWAIYVAGKFSDELARTVLEENNAAGLVDDVKFTELLAEIWGSLHRLRLLEQRQTNLNRFIPRTVLGKLGGTDVKEALKPQQADVTVMFTDLRGFSGAAEERAEELLVLLEQVSELHSIVTRHIVEQEGVIGDFQGDGVMSFWGWPNPQPDIAARVCRTALRIQAQFRELARGSTNPLAQRGFGIGIASGKAVAGLIGSADQVKASVFGPVVNLAARMEGMTKIFRVPILLDDTTRQMVQAQVPRDVARLRRLARVQPYGMNTVLTITELLPPATEEGVLSDADLAAYDTALQEFIDGNWARAFELLHRLPPSDLGTDFLTSVILQHRRTPPPDWKGHIPLAGKS
jgi:adenylate cyclase